MDVFLESQNEYNSEYDIQIVNGDFVVDEGLETTVLLSLLTNSGSWWGESFEDEPFGSKLFELDREKSTNSTGLKLKQYAEEALNWLVTEKIAKKITVDFMQIKDNIQLSINIQKPDNSDFKYYLNWKAQGEK